MIKSEFTFLLNVTKILTFLIHKTSTILQYPQELLIPFI